MHPGKYRQETCGLNFTLKIPKNWLDHTWKMSAVDIFGILLSTAATLHLGSNHTVRSSQGKYQAIRIDLKPADNELGIGWVRGLRYPV